MSFLSSFDSKVLEFLYAYRDPFAVNIFIGISELGTTVIMYGLSASVALLCFLYKRYAYAAGLLISTVSSGILILLLKGLIERARPPLSFQAYPEIWYSFPSAHAALSAALYFFLAYMTWKLVPHNSLRIIATIFFILLPLAISFSRVYLGVHYMSDVVAGLLLGSLCAWIGYRWVRCAHKS